jgi:GNAT superfamily N-acetyltransferase
LIAEIDREPVGFASYFLTFSSFLARPGLWMDDLYVHPQARGSGAGTALLCRLARLAEERGCARVEWTVAAANERGIGFYRKHGATVQESVRLARLDRAGIRTLADSQPREGHAR